MKQGCVQHKLYQEMAVDMGSGLNDLQKKKKEKNCSHLSIKWLIMIRPGAVILHLSTSLLS